MLEIKKYTKYSFQYHKCGNKHERKTVQTSFNSEFPVYYCSNCNVYTYTWMGREKEIAENIRGMIKEIEDFQDKIRKIQIKNLEKI